MPFNLDRYWRLLAAYMAPRRAALALLAALVFAGIGLQLLSPQIIRRFLDATQTGAPQSALLAAALAYIGVALAQRAAAFAALYLGENLGWQATNRLRADLARHVIALDLGFHKLHTPGELIQRLDGDVTTLAWSATPC
jgi:ATP-binding cassette, subfamily B, bacterial